MALELLKLPHLQDLPDFLALVWQLDAFASDDISRLCRVLAWRRDRPPSYIVPTAESLRAFAEECADAFETLPTEVQGHVLRLFSDPAEFRRSMQFEFRHVHKLPTPAPLLPPDLPRKTAEDLGQDAKSYASAGVWPVKERTVDPSEVAAALAIGEVVRFDASRFLDPELLNITLANIGRMDADRVAETSMDRFHVSLRCEVLLMSWADSRPYSGPWRDVWSAGTFYRWYREVCTEEPRRETKLGPLIELQRGLPQELGLLPVDPVLPWTEPLRIGMDGVFLHGRRISMPALTLNARRLPRFAERVLRGVEGSVGLGGQVDRLQASLNVAATSGSFHRDIEDNVFLQLAGEAHVFVFHCNISAEHVALQDDGASLFMWLLDPAFPARRELPFYHVVLHPGEGMTIPSQCVHAVVSRDPRRISVNVWFEPAFGRMVWKSAPESHFASMRPEYMAARFLWMRTLGRVWERHGIRMAHAFVNFEFL